MADLYTDLIQVPGFKVQGSTTKAERVWGSLLEHGPNQVRIQVSYLQRVWGSLLVHRLELALRRLDTHRLPAVDTRDLRTSTEGRV